MGIPFKKVIIIGVGLIGGSIAAAMKKLDNPPQVLGIGPHEESLKRAQDAKALDEYLLADDERVNDWLSRGNADLVIIATPVSAAREWFERVERCGYDGIITDDDTGTGLTAKPDTGKKGEGGGKTAAD